MDLAQRIDALEQIRAIEQLKYRYWRACDAKDPAAFRDCFVRSGARIDYGPLGAFDDVEPMVAIFTRIALHTVDGRHQILDMHHGMHPEITLTGEYTATGRWTLRFRQINLVEQTETLSTGEYDDEYRIEDGLWRMSTCHYTPTWSVTRPLPTGTVITEGAFADPAR
ncbi:nuclear transport factor 2 family protein [Nocardia stercoris]|uniref:Nuclear transport factor 2 family protein n=1 Tax=Nocardia stercoris TaxID=2483361 RepID=A0A3M2L0I4_9NOCA|nr:nuclear transport factor 2 family protein [Nocardia stercoris]RMI31239.1 nuclear transport factor 2 family protein [Nocardia stercoris]